MSKLIHIVDWTAKKILFEAYPMQGHAGWNPYAAFTVYPAINIITKTQTGTLTDKGAISKLVSESVTISKRLTQANMHINSLVSVHGIFFDVDARPVSPTFTVSGGLLQCSIDCEGQAIVEYNATVRLFEYNAQITTMLGNIDVKKGIVWAYDVNAPKNIVTYDVPVNPTTPQNRQDIITIYRQIIGQGAEVFEMPDNFPTSNDYSHYPSALDSDKPTTDGAYAVQAKNKHVVFINNGGYFDDLQAEYWNKPTGAGESFSGVVWKVKHNIPTDPTETISAELITQLNARLDELKTLYGIA